MAEETNTTTDAKQITAKELAEQITAMAEVHARTLPNTFFFIDAGKAVWTHGKPVPLPSYQKSLVIFAMFHEDDEVRIYCAPVVPDVGYTCFILSRMAQTLVADTMTLDVFKTAVADEIRRSAGVTHGAELEKELVLNYLGGLPNDYPLSEILEDIDADVHRQAVDDEEPETDAAPTNGATTAPSAATEPDPPPPTA